MSSRLLPWKKDDGQRRGSTSSDRRNPSGASPRPDSAVDKPESPTPPGSAVEPKFQQSQQSQQSQPSQQSNVRRRPVSFFATSPPPSVQGEERGDSMFTENKTRRPPMAGNGPGRPTFISRKSGTGTRSAPGSSHGNAESPSPLTQTYGPVELPGSLLLANEGFPSTDPGAGRLARWSRGPEKVLPSLAASLGLERPKAMTESPSITSRDSIISANSSFSNSTSPDATARPISSTPQSPNPSRLNHNGASRMASRPGFGSPKVISEAQRVSQVLARRVRDLEATVHERDETIKSFKTELEGARKMHEHEMAKVRELHSTEILSLKATFTLLERNQQDLMNNPLQTLQTSSLNGSSKMNVQPKGDGQDLVQSWNAELEAPKSTQSASESMPSITVSESNVAAEESIREEIRLEFEKRLEGERRRRKEVLERAQDLHQSREMELMERLDERDKQVCELEEEVAVWKDDVERVEESLKKFMQISEEYQAEAIRNAAAKRKAEAECITLQETIVGKVEALKDLRAELEEAKLKIGHSSLSVSNSNDSGTPPPAPPTEPGPGMTRIQQLEAEIKAHVEDIRLYKLDVRGYRKDVRSRDTKISYLAQHIADLEKKLHAKTIEAEDLRRRLMMAERRPEPDSQQSQQGGATPQRPRAATTGLGLNLDELADHRKGQTTPDWPLPHVRPRDHNSAQLNRHTRTSSSSGSGVGLNFSDHYRSENESPAPAMFPPGLQSHVRPLSPSFAARVQQQDLRTAANDKNIPTIPPKAQGRNKPLPIPKVNGKEVTAAHVGGEQQGLGQGDSKGVKVTTMEGVPGQSWILD